MSIRSDIGFAIRKDSGISQEMLEWIEETLDTKYEEEEGYLFIGESVKWDTYYHKELYKFMEELNRIDSDSFLLIEACSEYPQSGVDLGTWGNNPWRISKQVTSSLYFEI